MLLRRRALATLAVIVAALLLLWMLVATTPSLEPARAREPSQAIAKEEAAPELPSLALDLGPAPEAMAMAEPGLVGAPRVVLHPETNEPDAVGPSLILRGRVAAPPGRAIERVHFQFLDRNRAVRMWGSTAVPNGDLRIEVEPSRVNDLRAGSLKGARVLEHWTLHLADSKAALRSIGAGLQDREEPHLCATVELGGLDWRPIQRAGGVGVVDLDLLELAQSTLVGEVHFTGEWTDFAFLRVALGPLREVPTKGSGWRQLRVPRWNARVFARGAPIKLWSYTTPERWSAVATPDIPAFESRKARERGEPPTRAIRDETRGGVRLELHRPPQ